MMKQLIKSFLLNTGAMLHGNNGSKVIYYHDVHSTQSNTDMSTSMELFRKHIDTIRDEGYKIVNKIQAPEYEVMITFDDGFRGVWENFSFFEQAQIPFTIFLILDDLGKPEYLEIEEVKSLLASGLVSIGSHTLSHRNLDELAPEEMKMELCDSKKRLEELFCIDVNDICYPRGRFNDDVIKMSRFCGYKMQYSCLPGPYSTPYAKDVIKRNFVQHESQTTFRYYLQGGGEIFFSRYLKQHYRN